MIFFGIELNLILLQLSFSIWYILPPPFSDLSQNFKIVILANFSLDHVSLTITLLYATHTLSLKPKFKNLSLSLSPSLSQIQL
jgi:hypothetical protein